uniref:IP5PC-F beta-propeller domain-containing protein n=1 Tax=Leptocylindrus danicus TaxID=163516 RepID=A0A7S2JW42_9STRA|mmetsp:Transcript_1214/g.1755  ORF Transcript_1214/g.1755 Transcript_1214/m.1755 type:complete len:448 (+) Transcript_1214:75-1418(+)
MFGGGGGRHSNRGGGRGWGRGKGGRNYSGNRSRHHNKPPGQQRNTGQPPKYMTCRRFIAPNGSCNGCNFSHSLKCHATINAVTRSTQKQQHGGNSGGYQSQHDRNSSKAVNGCTVWESPGGIKIFSGGKDGHWRLWNSTQNFQQEFEQDMGLEVTNVEVYAGFLFCSFVGSCVALPDVSVGMVHVWNLSNPAEAPLEFHLDSQFTPYAHSCGVSSLLVTSTDEGSTDPSKMVLVSGDKKGVIRLWKPPATADQKVFVVQQTFYGHAGEVTGLVICNNFLWSASTDASIRTWDPATGECKYLISKTNQNAHTNAITDMVLWKDQSATFVLTSSLDSTVKAWNSSNGEMCISSDHGEGVICLATVSDSGGKPVLVCGLESGAILLRSLATTPSTPAFTSLLKIVAYYTNGIGHEDGPVKCLRAGPSNTFYSGGEDGKLNVWQVVGGLVD